MKLQRQLDKYELKNTALYDKAYDMAYSHFLRFSFRYERFLMNEFITFKRLF